MLKFMRSLLGEVKQKPIANRGRPLLEFLEERAVPAVLDLTAANATAVDNGVIYQQTSPQPTGSGVIHSFVRLHANGNAPVAQGYNTDARPLQYDENNSPVFTRAVKLSDVPVVIKNGIGYREFLLDINQKASSPLLSLDELRLYVAGSGNLAGYNPQTHLLSGNNSTLVYDLDASTDNYVKLDARLSHGSGSGDMVMLVPDAMLTAPGGDYVYLYSKFGSTYSSNGGFEEWAVHDQGMASASVSGTITVNNPNMTPTMDSSVLLTLSGVNDLGQQVTYQEWVTVSGSGQPDFYIFSGLRPGDYTVTIAPEDATNYQPQGSTTDTVDVTTDLIVRNVDFTLLVPGDAPSVPII